MDTEVGHKDSQPMVEELQLLLAGHREEYKVVLEIHVYVVTRQ